MTGNLIDNPEPQRVRIVFPCALSNDIFGSDLDDHIQKETLPVEAPFFVGREAFPWCQSYSIFRVVDASTLYQNKIEADKPKQSQEEVLAARLRGCQLNAPTTDSRVQQAREEQLKKALEDQDSQRRIEHQHLENVKKRLEIERRNVSEAERRHHDEQVAAEHSRQERDALAQQLEEANRLAQRREARLRQLELKMIGTVTAVHSPQAVPQRKNGPLLVHQFLGISEDDADDQFLDSQQQTESEEEEDDNVSANAPAARARAQAILYKTNLKEASRSAETHRTVARQSRRSDLHLSPEDLKVDYLRKDQNSPKRAATVIMEE